QQQLAGFVRRIAADRVLLEQARLVGADQDPEFQKIERSLRRELYSNDYLAVLPRPEPLEVERLREYYDENIEEFKREEKRQVFHIFRRYDASGGRDQALANLAALRDRLEGGESFERLAREHSQSETRFQGGLIGLVGRGTFPADFDDVVFALEDYVPSQPVATTDGAHLFLVRFSQDARDFAFEEVAPMIRQRLEENRRYDRRIEAAEDLPRPEPFYLASPAELQQILALGDPATVVLRVGDFALGVAEFREQVSAARRELGPRAQPDLPARVLADLQSRERIYQFLRDQGLEKTPPPAYFERRDRELVEFFARRAMTTSMERQTEAIKSHYDNNKMRFASPIRVQLEALTVPISDDGLAVSEALERARGPLDAGAETLEALAERYGGKVEDLGTLSAERIQALAPRALRFLFTLEPGQHTPPLTRGKALRVFKVLGRQEPQPRPLALVREAVVRDYLTHHSAQVFEQVTDQLLEQAGYRLFEDRLAGVTLGEPPSPS
ncbi:MAG: peptidyl-prolyl cis-trans isomerase, partial [Acidobacteriota bacterium]